MTSVLLAKDELHLHIGGAFPKAYLKSIASEEDFEAFDAALSTMHESDYHSLFQLFTLTQKIVHTEEKYFHGVKAIIHALAYDGVTYAELRTSLKDFGKGMARAFIKRSSAQKKAAFRSPSISGKAPKKTPKNNSTKSQRLNPTAWGMPYISRKLSKPIF
ncbi:MAG: hypothetical protein KDK62_06270 [Chlamydiia bacterium]|nr:hypothetical protein [Chlamydiia bacterium]